MSTLEDKILGEKLHYYCSSSSEDEGNDSDEYADLDDRKPVSQTTSTLPDFSEWDGTSSNTGPKGVLKDWERFKELEVEKMKEKQREQLELIKKLAFTCRTTLDEEKDKLLETDPEMASLLSDDFLLEYQKKRMKEMLMQAKKLRFGEVVDLGTADQFLKAVDEEDKSVTVIVHIYEGNIPSCEAMNGCLISLAKDYPHVKFCKILGSVAGLSKRFKQQGVPALLVYKKGQMVGNFIQLSEQLGDDFYSSDVENFLIENGILNDRKCVPAIISQNDSSDED